MKCDDRCVYKGKDMAKAHKGLDLSEGDFNALVEDLRRAFAKNAVPQGAGNRRLALLAPMKRELRTGNRVDYSLLASVA